MGLVVCGKLARKRHRSGSERRSPAGLVGGNTLSDFGYGQEHLTEVGDTVFRLMRLDEAPPADQEGWLPAHWHPLGRSPLTGLGG
jgi:hypothetical protein